MPLAVSDNTSLKQQQSFRLKTREGSQGRLFPEFPFFSFGIRKGLHGGISTKSGRFWPTLLARSKRAEKTT
jgi:hypothetical protein